MQPKSLFLIVLKILGLFFVKNAIEVIPQFISSLLFIFKIQLIEEQVILLLGAILTFGFYAFMTYLLIFKTDVIIDKLKLDRGFQEVHFSFDWKQATVLNVAVIILGGLLLTIEIPNLIKHLYQYVQYRSLQNLMPGTDLSVIISSIAKILIGLLLIGERSRITQWMIQGNNEIKTE